MNIGIISVDYFLPKTIVKTSEMMDELQPERFGVSNTFIEDNVGVKQVRHAETEQKPSELAIPAAHKAIASAGIRSDEIGVIIFCGIDRDYTEPSTAHNIQKAIGGRGFCFDVSNACLGFANGLLEAEMWVRAGRAKYALVCTGEKPSLVSKDWIEHIKRSDDLAVFKRKVGGLTVGDAGAAAVVGATESEAGFKGFWFSSEGEYADLCYYSMDQGERVGEMVMNKISAVMLRSHKRLYAQSLSELNWNAHDIGVLIAHQVGRKPWQKCAEIFNVDLNKLTKTYDVLGNITSATFPVNLALGLENGIINTGQKCFGALAGSGLSVVHFGLQL